MIRKSDLTELQARVLAFLDDGQIDEDAVGREIEELEGKPGFFRAADRLVDLGLAERHAGPSPTRPFSAWYRLTARGRKLVDTGQC